MPVSQISEENSSKKPAALAETPQIRDLFARFLRVAGRSNVVRIFLLILFLLAGAVAFAIAAYFCWFLWMPGLWSWGFKPGSAGKGLVALLGEFYLLLIPFSTIAFPVIGVGQIMRAYVEESEQKIKDQVGRIGLDQEAAETALEAQDPTGLVPLIRYSRLQLEAYYTIGLSQTQRSFRNGVIAMWIGFAVIIGGVIIQFIPLPALAATVKATGGVSGITTIAGGVIEAISALFLWVYRSSIGQLTYFYNRQMHVHSVVLCDRIAQSMSTAADDARRMIIEKVLAQSWQNEASGGSLLKLREAVSQGKAQ
jgi:hypothetical protein